jgi:hypothetical protein
MCTDYTDLNKACPKIFFHYPDKLNAGATYQWMMDKVFAKMIGKEVEVYIDDMIVWYNLRLGIRFSMFKMI